MKICILSPYATVAPHFETELEIAQRHLDEGDQVEIVSCWGALSSCEYNPEKDPSRCEDCRQRRQNGLLRLTPQVASTEIEPGETSTSLRFEFDSVDAIKAYELDQFDIGYAALSSLVSITRDPDPDLSEHQALWCNLLRSAWETYEFTREHLRRTRPDRVYVFNGRFANMRAVLRACEAEGIDCYVHERGCDIYHYDLFPNHLPHDIEKIHQRMLNDWQAASPEERTAIGGSWFEERVQRVEKSWHSFVKDQEHGKLPTGFSTQRKNIAIFNSSDDEFVSIGDQWINHLYPTQLEAVRRIVEDMLERDSTIHFYLRMHPNLRTVDNERKRQTLALTSPNLTVIPPDAPMDSYELVKQSDQVVTFGSSVGIEAVYWGTPSVLLGPCFYRKLGGTYQPRTHRETIELLGSELEPRDREPAIIYGYWLQKRGIPFQHFEATGLFEGCFKGAVITAEAPKIRRNFLRKVHRESQRLWSQFTGSRL